MSDSVDVKVFINSEILTDSYVIFNKDPSLNIFDLHEYLVFYGFPDLPKQSEQIPSLIKDIITSHNELFFMDPILTKLKSFDKSVRDSVTLSDCIYSIMKKSKEETFRAIVQKKLKEMKENIVRDFSIFAKDVYCTNNVTIDKKLQTFKKLITLLFPSKILSFSFEFNNTTLPFINKILSMFNDIQNQTFLDSVRNLVIKIGSTVDRFDRQLDVQFVKHLNILYKFEIDNKSKEFLELSFFDINNHIKILDNDGKERLVPSTTFSPTLKILNLTGCNLHDSGSEDNIFTGSNEIHYFMTLMYVLNSTLTELKLSRCNIETDDIFLLFPFNDTDFPTKSLRDLGYKKESSNKKRQSSIGKKHSEKSLPVTGIISAAGVIGTGAVLSGATISGVTSAVTGAVVSGVTAAANTTVAGITSAAAAAPAAANTTIAAVSTLANATNAAAGVTTAANTAVAPVTASTGILGSVGTFALAAFNTVAFWGGITFAAAYSINRFVDYYNSDGINKLIVDLEKLDLSNNKIIKINTSINYLTRLKYINLSNNKLQDFDHSLFARLKSTFGRNAMSTSFLEVSKCKYSVLVYPAQLQQLRTFNVSSNSKFDLMNIEFLDYLDFYPKKFEFSFEDTHLYQKLKSNDKTLGCNAFSKTFLSDDTEYKNNIYKKCLHQYLSNVMGTFGLCYGVQPSNLFAWFAPKKVGGKNTKQYKSKKNIKNKWRRLSHRK
jgi:Leucine-rich repeat (LRR) protein